MAEDTPDRAKTLPEVLSALGKVLVVVLLLLLGLLLLLVF